MYTTVATVDETIVSCGLTSCVFQTTGGNFNIYYNTNTATFADQATGLNYAAGTGIISGTVNAKPLTDTFDNTGGTPTFNLTGAVTSTNSTYINPALLGSTFSTTLQLGPNQTDFTPPTTFNGTAFAAGQYVFQADANQTFTTVPELRYSCWPVSRWPPAVSLPVAARQYDRLGSVV